MKNSEKYCYSIVESMILIRQPPLNACSFSNRFSEVAHAMGRARTVLITVCSVQSHGFTSVVLTNLMSVLDKVHEELQSIDE